MDPSPSSRRRARAAAAKKGKNPDPASTSNPSPQLAPDDEDDDSVTPFPPSFTSTSTALQGLLRRLSAGLDDLLLESTAAAASSSTTSAQLKGFSAAAPSSFPHPTVLPFPVARRCSHGPHWNPIAKDADKDKGRMRTTVWTMGWTCFSCQERQDGQKTHAESVAERDFLRTEGDPAAVDYTINEAVALTRSMLIVLTRLMIGKQFGPMPLDLNQSCFSL